MRPDVDVERILRRAVDDAPADLGDAAGGLAGFGGHPSGIAQGAERLLRQPDRRPDEIADPGRDQLGSVRLRLRSPAVVASLLLRGRSVEVKEDGGDVDAGNAVDERVVGLVDQGEAARLEALDKPYLPQGLGAIEALGEDPGGEAAQLIRRAGRRESGVANVIGDVEVGVVDPQRAPHLHPRHRQLLPVAGNEVEP